MDDLFAFYKHELNSLSQQLKEFGEKYPELASNVSLVENPHVSRLIQAFSILHAKLNLVLEESFVQFTSSLFDILYPHYNTPLPSFTILALEPPQKLKEPFLLPKGKLLTMESNNNICTFQVCYNTEILPLEVIQASCSNTVDKDLVSSGASTVKSILTIHLSSLKEADSSKIEKIRFFIKGLNDTDYLIYKNIINNVVSIKISELNDTSSVQEISKDAIKEVGFAGNENILPSNDTSFIGYKLITEFFAFTQKFLFFDLDLSSINLTNYKEWQICFYLDNEELESLVTKDNFLLNVTPIVNLFPLESDPIKVVGGKAEYQIIMDNKNLTHNKIYSLEKVKIIMGDQEKVGAHLFNFDYNKYSVRKDIFWYLTKRQSITSSSLDKELYISLVDKDIILNTNENDKYFYINAYCFNGNLPFNTYLENNSGFKFIDNTIAVTKVKPLSRPSKAHRLCENNDQRWNVIAHLSLNHFSLITGNNGKEIFKEMLAIYNAGNLSINKLLIDNIIDVKVTEKVARIKIGKAYQFCKGNLVEIYFNLSQLTQGLLYLFLRVLEEFFAMYCSINSFVQLLGKTKEENILYCGHPRNGTKCLI